MALTIANFSTPCLLFQLGTPQRFVCHCNISVFISYFANRCVWHSRHSMPMTNWLVLTQFIAIWNILSWWHVFCPAAYVINYTYGLVLYQVLVPHKMPLCWYCVNGCVNAPMLVGCEKHPVQSVNWLVLGGAFSYKNHVTTDNWSLNSSVAVQLCQTVQTMPT